MSFKMYYSAEAPLTSIEKQVIAVVGYGSQGHAHALNLSDSGVEVEVGLRPGSASWTAA